MSKKKIKGFGFRAVLTSLQVIVRNNITKVGFTTGGGGYPILTSLGGLPHPDLTGGGYPWIPHLGLGYLPGTRVPPSAGTGVPPGIGTWDQSLGYPQERTWDQWKYYGM